MASMQTEEELNVTCVQVLVPALAHHARSLYDVLVLFPTLVGQEGEGGGPAKPGGVGARKAVSAAQDGIRRLPVSGDHRQFAGLGSSTSTLSKAGDRSSDGFTLG